MVDLKVLKITAISLLVLTMSCGGTNPKQPVRLKMSNQQLNEAIYRYLSTYDEIKQGVVNEFSRIVHENADIFNYLTEAKTDPEFLPYLEKYSSLKMQYKNQPINTNVKVLFSTHPLKTSDHLKYVKHSGYCNFFTQSIFIDRGFWKAHRDNERARESILFHELGHCDLDRKHFLLRGDFSSYIQTENFSFMNGDIIYSLLFSLLTESELRHLVIDEYNLYSHRIKAAKMDLDQTFESMYQELFSKENTRNNFACEGDDECVQLTQEKSVGNFKSEVLSVLRHTTIGPSQGKDFQDLITRVRLQHICYFYNRDDYTPLNDYLEEQDEMTDREVVRSCQLNEFNNRRLL